jgi:Leg1
MGAAGGYPAELESLDLFAVWATVPPLDDRFDPFSFPQRMAAYRTLIEATNRRGQFGDDNRRNPLWGLAFQHHWQYRSGRLGPHTLRDGRIDPDAPWGYGNHVLCVIPWLAAASTGLVPDLPVLPPPGPSRFDYPSGGGGPPLRLPEPLRAGVEDWRRFFRAADAAAPSDDEPVRLALWKAHKTCLDVVARRLATIDPAPYAPAELTFLRGWCRMVDYLWAAAWRTDFDFTVRHGLAVLPDRLLADHPAGQVDLPARVARNVATVTRLAQTPGWRHRLNLTLWQRAMRTRQARDDVLAMLDAVFNPNPANGAARRRLVAHLLRP